jgi:hypothetical protein
MHLFRIAALAAHRFYRNLLLQPSDHQASLRKPLVTWVGQARTRREDELLRREGMTQAQ